jgi:hypothetical protein
LVPAGAHDVQHDVGPVGAFDHERIRQHHIDEGGHLSGTFPLGAQRHCEAADLRRGGIARQDLGHGP